jgi:hypothetical protein
MLKFGSRVEVEVDGTTLLDDVVAVVHRLVIWQSTVPWGHDHGGSPGSPVVVIVVAASFAVALGTLQGRHLNQCVVVVGDVVPVGIDTFESMDLV